jgi:hypothetical protein
MNSMTLRAALLGALVAGCSSSNGTTLSLSTQSENEATPASVETQSLDLGNGIVLDEVWMVVRRIELSGDAACPAEPEPEPETPAATLVTSCGEGCGGGDDVGDGDCDRDCDQDCDRDCGEDCDRDCDDGCQLAFGPFPVVITGDALVSGIISWAFDVTVPPGIYDELEIQVNTIPAGKAGDDPVLLAMADAHASVIAAGTVDGAPFAFATPVSFEQEQEPFEVPAEGANVTLQFDPSTWFVDCAGNRLNPLDLHSRAEITQNIRASLRLFQDDDMDGCDDDGEDGDGGCGRGRR